ncbi:MAG: CheR family methyltransferase [Paracoccaceae bacterium]
MSGTLGQRGRIGPDEARFIVETVYRLSGVSVTASKTDFLEHRLNRLLQESGVGSVAEYVAQLRAAPAGPAAQGLVEALTTHTTSFFRERAHFDWLTAEGLPAVTANGAGRDRPLTVWSAACSTGAELWTAGMVVDGFARSRSLRWGLVGTDVSQKILAKAALATFEEDDILPIPDDMRRRYLLRSRAGAGKARYRIAPDLRSRARLAWANLLDLPTGMALTADIAFLRNVLIYFEADDQLRAAANVARRIQPGGYLLTGHSEGLASAPPGMVLVAPSIYRKE